MVTVIDDGSYQAGDIEGIAALFCDAGFYEDVCY